MTVTRKCNVPKVRSWYSAQRRAKTYGRATPSVDSAVEDGGDLAHFVGEDGKFFGEDGLHAVGESFVRLVMDFDEQAIGADGDSCAGERKNFVALAGAMAGIDEDGEVAAFFDGWDYGEIERVA